MIDESGRISIRGLRVEAHIGVTEDERAKQQALLIDIDIETDVRDAARSDDVEDTIDYGAVVDDVAAFVRSSRYRLLERLGAEIGELICRDPRVVRVTVDVGKETPPVSEVVSGLSVGVSSTGERVG